MFYEAARIYAERNGMPEAITLLNRALKLDPENHRANALKQKLIADGSVNRNAGLDIFLQTDTGTDQTGMDTDQNGTNPDQNGTVINRQ